LWIVVIVSSFYPVITKIFSRDYRIPMLKLYRKIGTIIFYVAYFFSLDFYIEKEFTEVDFTI